jgi:hypothetical protein
MPNGRSSLWRGFGEKWKKWLLSLRQQRADQVLL